jgi:hypothetical protein
MAVVGKAFVSVPGLGELVDIRFDLGDGINGDKSSLQIAVRLEKPGRRNDDRSPCR